MKLDILAALEASPPSRSANRRCKIQAWLDDEVPADAAGREQLLATIETTDPKSPDYRTIDDALRVLSRLGLHTSDATLSLHRRRKCRCFD